MSIQTIRFTGKLPYSVRPLRGAARKNKRLRKKFNKRIRILKYAERYLAMFNFNLDDISRVK